MKSRHRGGLLLHRGRRVETAEAKGKCRHHQQIEERRGGQTAEDDHRHGPLDFAAGFTGAHRQGKQAHARDEGGHEDGHEAFGCAAHGGFLAPGHALDTNEMLEVRKQHDGIARGDAEEGDETHHGANGQRTELEMREGVGGVRAEKRPAGEGMVVAGEDDRKHAADHRKRKIHQQQHQVAKIAEDDGQQNEDAHAGNGGVQEQLVSGGGFGLGFPGPVCMNRVG